jgi:pentatricopeptide repeat protein
MLRRRFSVSSSPFSSASSSSSSVEPHEESKYDEQQQQRQHQNNEQETSAQEQQQQRQQQHDDAERDDDLLAESVEAAPRRPYDGGARSRRNIAQMTRIPSLDELHEEANALKPGQRYLAFQLLSLYRFAQSLDGMLDLFERLPELAIVPDVFAWNDVIAACVREKRFDLAMMYWDAMVSSDIRPGRYSYVIVVIGFIEASDRVNAARLLLESETNGFLLSTQIYRRYLNLLNKQRAYDEMRDVYARMGRLGVARDVDVYSLMIRAAADEAKIEDVRAYFATLLEAGLTPTIDLLATIVVAEYTIGSPAEGWRVVNEFSKYNLTPPLTLLLRIINEEDRHGNTVLIPRIVLYARQLGYPIRLLYAAAMEAMLHVDVIKYDAASTFFVAVVVASVVVVIVVVRTSTHALNKQITA